MFRYINISKFFVGIVFISIVNGLTVLPAMSLELGFEKTTATDVIDDAADAHAQINTLRKQTPIDIAAIESLYLDKIQALVKEADTANSLALDTDILKAIDDIRNQIDAPLAAQVLDKTIRRVFLIIAMDRSNKVKSDFNSKTAEELNKVWDEGFAAFDAIDGTIGQKTKILSEDRLLIIDGKDPGLNDNVIRAFINGQDAVNKDSGEMDEGVGDGDLTRIKVQRQIVRFTMERGFYLIVLKEIQDVLKKRDSDPIGARVNQKEGEVFHTAIASKVKKDNDAGNSIIEAQLKGPLEGIVAEVLIKEYSKAWMNGTIRELDANSGAMGSGDVQKAVETAYEGILFANMMIDDLEQRLGKTNRDMVTKAFGDLILASAKGSMDEALAQREIIRDILEEYGKGL